MKTIEVTIELLEEMLGTANADAKIHEDYIASKAPDAKSREEEVAALGADAVVEKSKTIFPKEDGNRSSIPIKSADSSKRPLDSCNVAKAKSLPPIRIKSRLTRKSLTVASLSNREKS